MSMALFNVAWTPEQVAAGWIARDALDVATFLRRGSYSVFDEGIACGRPQFGSNGFGWVLRHREEVKASAEESIPEFDPSKPATWPASHRAQLVEFSRDGENWVPFLFHTRTKLDKLRRKYKGAKTRFAPFLEEGRTLPELSPCN